MPFQFLNVTVGVLVAAAMSLPCCAGEPLAEHVVLITVDGLPAYLLDDPSAVLPNIRGLAARGSHAAGMVVSNPSVTWPNHTTLVTGVSPAKHGVLFNGVLERPGLGVPVKVDGRKDKLELVQVPTLFDVLHQAGKTSAGINWPCTRNSKTLDVDFPDSPESLDHTTPALIDELKTSGAVSDDDLRNFGSLSAPARDRIWTLAACHVIRTHKPNFLMFHLLNVDGTHHKFGPKSAAGYTAVAYADSCVGDLLDAIDDTGIAESTAVIVVSDHGFIPIPKSLRPNVLLRQAGLLTVEGKTVATANVYAVPEGGTALVYLTSPDTSEADRRKALAAFHGQEGIDEVLTPDAYGELGLPTPTQSRQAPDLVLSAKDGYGFSADATGDEFVVANEGTPGTHGFLSTNPRMNAVFVAAGSGIRKGARLGVIRNLSIAPTIASLLGVSLGDVDGGPLTEILGGDSKIVREAGSE